MSELSENNNSIMETIKQMQLNEYSEILPTIESNKSNGVKSEKLEEPEESSEEKEKNVKDQHAKITEEIRKFNSVQRSVIHDYILMYITLKRFNEQNNYDAEEKSPINLEFIRNLCNRSKRLFEKLSNNDAKQIKQYFRNQGPDNFDEKVGIIVRVVNQIAGSSSASSNKDSDSDTNGYPYQRIPLIRSGDSTPRNKPASVQLQKSRLNLQQKLIEAKLTQNRLIRAQAEAERSSTTTSPEPKPIVDEPTVVKRGRGRPRKVNPAAPKVKNPPKVATRINRVTKRKARSVPSASSGVSVSPSESNSTSNDSFNLPLASRNLEVTKERFLRLLNLVETENYRMLREEQKQLRITQCLRRPKRRATQRNRDSFGVQPVDFRLLDASQIDIIRTNKIPTKYTSAKESGNCNHCDHYDSNVPIYRCMCCDDPYHPNCHPQFFVEKLVALRMYCCPSCLIRIRDADRRLTSTTTTTSTK